MVKGKKYAIDRLKLDLALSIRSFCLYFLPNGKYVGGEYTVGSLGGEPGKSLKICLTEEKTGMWKDFATGESGNNLLDLLCKMRGGDFRAACEEAANWLNNPERYGIKPQGFIRQLNGESSMSLLLPAHLRSQRKPLRLKHHNFYDLTGGIIHDRTTLARLLGVNGESLDHAVGDGVLKFFDQQTNGRCWSVVDKDHYVRQDRRLDGKPFIFQDQSMAKARTMGSPSWPVGIPTPKEVIMLAEGSSDFLAAYSLAYSEDLGNIAAPVTILGASNVIHPDALKHFQGKRVLGFPDYDAAGITGMSRWRKQLIDIAAEFEVFDYTGMVRDDGQPVKDLRDFLHIDVDQWEQSLAVRHPLGSFLNPPLNQ
ncbi:MAG: hypothetical protein LBD34_00270 [Puniceicoccales bacterium]|jgi:hypothetical protein|nr:hypothetical protein [Puniceicoccales bacterium]